VAIGQKDGACSDFNKFKELGGEVGNTPLEKLCN
jgi:hypothetical protein